ncbi:IS66 family insertion sequence element accessory protein TnpB, partial [Vibrio viridaestus]
MRYYLCPGATDMRKSFYTLSGLVVNVMKQDVRSGDVFIFINRKRTTMKILHA